MMPGTGSNNHVYEDPEIVQRYAGLTHLHEAEERIFADLLPLWENAKLLDIGVGAGRTTATLAARVSTYVGIEPSERLLAAARAAHPGIRLELGDARDLHQHCENEFEAVFFSFNGIDYVDDEGRGRALDEIRRVLRPGGTFLFSSHNRDHDRFGLLPWQGRPRWGRTTLRRSWEAIRATGNRRRLRELETHEAAYAIINDDAHGYSLLTYYISPREQVAQLHRHGFDQVMVYDRWGIANEQSPESAWMYYLAR